MIKDITLGQYYPVESLVHRLEAAVHVRDVRFPRSADGLVQVVVEFEANYEQQLRPTDRPQAYYVRECWWLCRKAGVRSRPPDKSRMIVCPSCGAPVDMVQAGVCHHCSAVDRKSVV